MEDWKILHVEHINRKRGAISAARGACTPEQLKALDALEKAASSLDFELTENLTGGGSANDVAIGTYTDLMNALLHFQTQWVDSPTPDFYDEVMELKRQETAEEIQSFEQLYEDLNNLSCVNGKKCVSCGKNLEGRQKKLCGKKKCKDKYYGKKAGG